MSEENDYSAYINYHLGILQTDSLLSGFTFTAITIILAIFPDPSQVRTQIVLFVLGFLLNVFLLYVVQEEYLLANCVRIAPPLPDAWKRSWSYVYFELIGWTLLSMSVALMFWFLWNLIYLAIVSVIVTTLFIIYAYLTVIKPLHEFYQAHQFVRK